MVPAQPATAAAQCSPATAVLSPYLLPKHTSFAVSAVPRSQLRPLSLSPRWSFRRLYLPSAPCAAVAASVTAVDSPASPSTNDGKKLLLEVKDLTAAIAESGQKIPNGVNLSVYEGEIRSIELLIDEFAEFYN